MLLHQLLAQKGKREVHKKAKGWIAFKLKLFKFHCNSEEKWHIYKKMRHAKSEVQFFLLPALAVCEFLKIRQNLHFFATF